MIVLQGWSGEYGNNEEPVDSPNRQCSATLSWQVIWGTYRRAGRESLGIVDWQPESMARALSDLIVQTLMVGSGLVWVWTGRRWQRGLPVIPTTASRTEHYSAGLLAFAWGWVLFLVWSRLQRELSPQNEPVDLPTVSLSLLLSVCVWVLLVCLWLPLNTSVVAIWKHALGNAQELLKWGSWGYLLAIGPTLLLVLLSAAWRSPETQHSYLLALERSPSLGLLLLMILSAVVVAPMTEEMLFRVVLQGWLRQQMGKWKAVLLVAVLFAAIHGWRDALALLPLALTLGLVYECRGDYLTVVVTHAWFNGIMLVLQALKVLNGGLGIALTHVGRP